jgi:ubiquinone/menaquinone biosynthesis C-methylase UbiE
MFASYVPAESIDVVYTSNALDHTREPLKVIAEAEKVLRRGGRLAVGVATHEGTKQSWDQFHKTDIYVRDGEVVFNHQNGPVVPLLGGRMKLTKINSNDDVWLTFIAEKT